MVTIGYARVEKNEAGLEEQEARLQAAGCSKVYSENHRGVSRQATRTTLGHAIRAVENGDVFMADSFDRIGRSAVNMLELFAGLRERGVHIVSLKEKIDTREPGGDALLRLVVAMLACEGVSEDRIHASITAAEAPALDALRSKIRTKQLDEIAQCVDLGWTTKRIAEKLNVNETTIRRAYKAMGRKVDNRYANRTGVVEVHQAAR